METFETKEDIAKKIRQKREALGIKDQIGFARLLGMKPPQYNRYEKGVTRPRDETLKKILRYGVPSGLVGKILEPGEPYIPKTLKENAHDNIDKIFKSGNEKMIELYMSNTKVILEAIQAGQKQNEDKGNE